MLRALFLRRRHDTGEPKKPKFINILGGVLPLITGWDARANPRRPWGKPFVYGLKLARRSMDFPAPNQDEVILVPEEIVPPIYGTASVACGFPAPCPQAPEKNRFFRDFSVW